MPRRAIYPGSFDPITFGHIDVVERALGLFDEVVLAVAFSELKKPLFTLKERQQMAQEAIRGLGQAPRLRVVAFDGLLVDLAMQEEAVAIIRGLRVMSDFEFEFQLALTNRKLNPNVETVFLMPKENLIYLSSSIVKEIARLKGNVARFVPSNVYEALQVKFQHV